MNKNVKCKKSFKFESRFTGVSLGTLKNGKIETRLYLCMYKCPYFHISARVNGFGTLFR